MQIKRSREDLSRTSKRTSEAFKARGHWGHLRGTPAATLIAAALLLLVSAAQSDELDDLIEELNELITQAGPVI